MNKGYYEILSNTKIAPDTYEMVLRGDTSSLSNPGQFINIALEGLYLRRPISVCHYEEGQLTIIYKAVGKGTKQMTTMQAGQQLDILCGLGNGFDTSKAKGKKAAVIGGGVGVPPMYDTARRLIAEGVEVTAILGFATKDAAFYIVPPFVTNEADKTAKLGRIETAAKKGDVSVTCESSTDAMSYTRTLLSYIPQNNTDGTAYQSVTDEINRLTPNVDAIVAADCYKMADVITAISDDAKFMELGTEYAKSMLTGFVTLNGMVIGVVANNPAEKSGKLTACAAKKAARFISFCDCFDIPLLTLVDTEGYDISVDEEKGQYAEAMAKLASAYASSEMAKVTVVLGKAYGAAYTIMGSKSIGADIALACDSAKISAMPTKSAVAFAWNDRVTDNSKRAEAEAEWDTVMASPVVAAKAGEIDDIIELSELRQRASAAFEMLGAKNALVDVKRHNNLPL